MSNKFSEEQMDAIANLIMSKAKDSNDVKYQVDEFLYELLGYFEDSMTDRTTALFEELVEDFMV